MINIETTEIGRLIMFIIFICCSSVLFYLLCKDSYSKELTDKDKIDFLEDYPWAIPDYDDEDGEDDGVSYVNGVECDSYYCDGSKLYKKEIIDSYRTPDCALHMDKRYEYLTTVSGEYDTTSVDSLYKTSIEINKRPKRCENCGAPLHDDECEYCGTEY